MLVVKRKSELNNKSRKIDLYLNNEKIESIENGKSITMNLTPGSYELYAKIDWCRSQILTVNVENDRDTIVELSGFKYGALITPITLSCIVLFYAIKWIFKIDVYYFFILPTLGFLYQMYFYTFGKDKFLFLKEV